jgi:hypothetical protein
MLKEALSRSRPGWKNRESLRYSCFAILPDSHFLSNVHQAFISDPSLVRLPIPPLSRCAVEKIIQADVEATLTVVPLGCTGDGDQRSNTPYLPKIKVAPSAGFH